MDYKLVLDVIVAILLAATITYAVMLNGRLVQLRKNRDELAKLVSTFNEATARAEASIPKLKKAAEDAGSTLQERVEKAHALRDDLAFMIERADSMANRLEGTVRDARTQPKPSPLPTSRPAARPGQPPAGPAAIQDDDLDDDRSEAERELLRALQSVR